ncbi:hypothetical protein OIU84_008105 [Salix udensis]|uniref:Uncharacterized protein n=1 Tax=Salix udensis TaxID=889485 RepID=A0AAD6P090_9ROSI|nr:hypothetical protein OIU84_008105 [Salix udensis]
MSTPLTMTRLVGWRVRDWASCFLARSFSLGDEQETFHNSPSKLPVRNRVFGVKKDSTRAGTPAGPTRKMRSTLFFAFGEDGGFDVVKEWKSSETLGCLDTANCTSPRSVHRKLHCVEVSETTRESSHQRSVNGHETETTPVKTEQEAAGSHSGPDQPCNARTRWCQSGEIDNCGTLSAKSSVSNQSDGSSTGSFSFPVMQWELTGSPVQMPKPDSLYARKPCARFQCCRF